MELTTNLFRHSIDELNTLLAGKTLFVAYDAGRPASSQGIQESSFAREQGFNLTHYVGRFESLRVTKKGDLLLTLFVFDRGQEGEGKFRSFNPTLGRLRGIEVLG